MRSLGLTPQPREIAAQTSSRYRKPRHFLIGKSGHAILSLGSIRLTVSYQIEITDKYFLQKLNSKNAAFLGSKERLSSTVDV